MYLITNNKIFKLILLLFVSINLNVFSIDDDLFNDKVLPILENNCFKCHGANKKKSGLRIDLRQHLINGGDSGLPTIIPGDWSKSYLMEVVTHKDEEMAMPPKDEKLSLLKFRKISWVILFLILIFSAISGYFMIYF